MIVHQVPFGQTKEYLIWRKSLYEGNHVKMKSMRSDIFMEWETWTRPGIQQESYVNMKMADCKQGEKRGRDLFIQTSQEVCESTS